MNNKLGDLSAVLGEISQEASLAFRLFRLRHCCQHLLLYQNCTLSLTTHFNPLAVHHAQAALLLLPGRSHWQICLKLEL